MYMAVVSLTMLILPVGSVLIEHAMRPEVSLVGLVGRWFVFWSVGVRQGLAGMRQVAQPAFTAREIFHMQSDEALPLVRELGAADLAVAVVGLASIIAPSFVLPAAISAGLFYAWAGTTHLREQARSRNENLAMVTDIFMGLMLASFALATILHLAG